MAERIGDLTIEVIDDADGRLIMLEQDSCGNIDRVSLHAIHVRYLAEKLGLTHLADPTAQRTIASLTRRIRVLVPILAGEWPNAFISNGSAVSVATIIRGATAAPGPTIRLLLTGDGVHVGEWKIGGLIVEQ